MCECVCGMGGGGAFLVIKVEESYIMFVYVKYYSQKYFLRIIFIPPAPHTSPPQCLFNPIALRMAKTLQSFAHSECSRVKHGHQACINSLFCTGYCFIQVTFKMG